MVSPTFYNLSLNFAISISWSQPVSSQSCFCWLYGASPSSDAENIINQISFGIDHLVIPMCRVISCAVGTWCLLSPVHSLGKILLAFDLLCFVLRGQICLLFQVSLDFLLVHFMMKWTNDEKNIIFGCWF